jgi:hypothetical protein
MCLLQILTQLIRQMLNKMQKEQMLQKIKLKNQNNKITKIIITKVATTLEQEEMLQVEKVVVAHHWYETKFYFLLEET